MSDKKAMFAYSSPPREAGTVRYVLRRLAHYVVALFLLGVTVPFRAAEEEPRPQPERDLGRPIVFGMTESSFPYQFRDRDGKLKGFSTDIADAVARVMNLPLTRIAISSVAMPEALRTGRVDVVQFWTETPERHRWADFTVPILRLETVIVARKGDGRIQHFADLDGKRVAVGPSGTMSYMYLRTEHPNADAVFTEANDESLRMLAMGQVDAAVMSRLTAMSTIEHFGFKNLRVLDDRIKGDAYDVRFCFTVRKGDALLLARLNEGLAIIHRTGEFDRIYHRWFGQYEGRTFSALQVVSYVAAALALAFGVATWGLMRQRTLRRHVAQQASELASQRSLLAALYDRHPMATAILDVAQDGAVLLVSANPQGSRLFGVDPSRPLPDDLRRGGLSHEATEYLEDAVRRWRATGEASHWEARLGGGQRLLEAALVPLGRGEDGATRLCVLSNDVTERRLVDHELAQSRRLRALGELVGGIAHEFNNLLTPIIMTTSQARLQRSLPPPLQADFTVIDNAARRAAELTKRLLTFGRGSDERPQPVLLKETVENCFALLRSTVDRRVHWSIRAPEDLPPLIANPTDLNQIVFNLVINARDTLLQKLAQPHDQNWAPQLEVILEELPSDAFSRSPAHAQLAAPAAAGAPATAPTAWQRLTVVDNGLGIPSEITDRIFEPFFTTKQIGQGTGLGLATVWHLVAEFGGDIGVQSELGKGTRFMVTLPRWAKPAEPAVAGAGNHGRTSSTRGLRIMLAEDDPLVTRAALAVLERARHVVTHCADGSEAWARLVDGGTHFDVLLLDLNMPRLNGTDLIRRIRKGVFHGAIAVMSGRVTEDERQALAELNVDRIIHKPFSATDLIEAVRELATKRP